MGELSRTSLARLLEMWSSLVLRQNLRPGFGLVGWSISEEQFEFAVPKEMPPSFPDEIDPEFEAELPTGNEARFRAAKWASFLRRIPDAPPPRQVVHTVYGLVAMTDGIRLGVIYYVKPRDFVRFRAVPAPLRFRSETFPVVLRPWIPHYHGKRGTSHCDGHCWVKTSDGIGVLTARHIIRPKNAIKNDLVTVASFRTKITGRLYETSAVMDAAVVIPFDPPAELSQYRNSKTVGFKNVRLEFGHNEYQRPIEGTVTGTAGIDSGIFLSEPWQEPPLKALMTFGVYLEAGDSGCLVLDIESEEYGHVHPYILYQGVLNLSRGQEGFGLFIQQALVTWGLETVLDPAQGSISA